METGECEVFGGRFAPVLARADVVDLKGGLRNLAREPAVFAAPVRPLPNELLEFQVQGSSRGSGICRTVALQGRSGTKL